jgi:hypothetical protein
VEEVEEDEVEEDPEVEEDEVEEDPEVEEDGVRDQEDLVFSVAFVTS